MDALGLIKMRLEDVKRGIEEQKAVARELERIVNLIMASDEEEEID